MCNLSKTHSYSVNRQQPLQSESWPLRALCPFRCTLTSSQLSAPFARMPKGNSMPRVLLAIGLALCFRQIAAAQDTPEWQVYAGGSYGHGEISPAIPGLSSVNGWGYNVD